MARQETNRLLEMIDEGVLDPKSVVTMCVKYMSEDDVADMMDCNELSERFDEDEEDYEDDGQPTWEQEWEDFGECYE
jgi:threonine dehydrogenase-like Zn-dependent dehydrogenase